MKNGDYIFPARHISSKPPQKVMPVHSSDYPPSLYLGVADIFLSVVGSP